jgi:hypothetical protein
MNAKESGASNRKTRERLKRLVQEAEALSNEIKTLLGERKSDGEQEQVRGST